MHLFGEDVTHQPPQARARKGLGRTFQRMELFDTLTVAENVALGKEASLAGRNPFKHIRATATQAASLRKLSNEAMEQCGIVHLAQPPTRRSEYRSAPTGRAGPVHRR